MRKAWIHCRDGDGFSVACMRNYDGHTGQVVTVVYAGDESQAAIVAENWEKEGILSYEKQG